MSRYDLRSYKAMTWARFQKWFRLAFSVFLILVTAWVAYGAYIQAAKGMLSPLTLVGIVLILLVLALFTFVVAAMRPPAVDLTLDEDGFRLDFERGSPDVRSWQDWQTRLRGRYTPGARDSISAGQPLWSVYGRFGALTESFIPGPAFDELVTMAKAHGFALSEQSGRPGWTLYSLERADRKA